LVADPGAGQVDDGVVRLEAGRVDRSALDVPRHLTGPGRRRAHQPGHLVTIGLESRGQRRSDEPVRPGHDHAHVTDSLSPVKGGLASCVAAAVGLATGSACSSGGGSHAAVTPRPTTAAVVASSGCGSAAAIAPGVDHVSLAFGGVTRTARQFVPKGYDRRRPVAIVLNLHGFSSNADQEAVFTGMESFADTNGFVVLFPDGTGSPRYWNLTVDPRGADDIGYLRALIDDAGRRLCLDRRRVFMTGMSNGAGMTSAAACHLADIVAAFAPVAGV